MQLRSMKYTIVTLSIIGRFIIQLLRVEEMRNLQKKEGKNVTKSVDSSCVTYKIFPQNDIFAFSRTIILLKCILKWTYVIGFLNFAFSMQILQVTQTTQNDKLEISINLEFAIFYIFQPNFNCGGCFEIAIDVANPVVQLFI